MIHLHDVVIVPEDAVLVELLRRVEPQMKPFFLALRHAPIPVYVRLQHPLLPLHMPQKLEVDLVVTMRISIGVRHL